MTVRLEDPKPVTSQHPCCRICYLTAYFLFDIYCFGSIWQQNKLLLLIGVARGGAKEAMAPQISNFCS